MNTRDPLAIADVQNSQDTRHLAIDKVGIKAIRHPVKVSERSGGVQHTIANFSMYVDMLHQMVEKLEAQSGNIEMNFPYFINKSAPVSGVESLMDYDVTFIGGIEQG